MIIDLTSIRSRPRTPRASLLACVTCLLLAITPRVVAAQPSPSRRSAQGAQAPSRSPQITVTAKAPASRFAGDTIPLEVVVSGSKAAQVPQIPPISGARVEYRDAQDRSSSFTMSVNGRVTSRSDVQVVYVYEITPERGGVIVIPPIPVVVDGATYTTQPLAVQIVEPHTDPDFKLELAMETVDAYVNQPIAVTLTWTIAKDIRGLRFSFPVPDGFDLVSPPSPDPRRAPKTPLASRDDRFPEIAFNGQTVIAEIGQRQENGKITKTLTVRQILVPRREGAWTIGPARVDYQAVIGQRQRRFTDAPWDDLSILDRQMTRTEPVSMRVHPLPEAGRPAGFSGLVGQFAIMASASTASGASAADGSGLEVGLGEPIDLKVSITGTQPLSAIPPLDLAQSWRDEKGLRAPLRPILPDLTPGAAMFDARVRVRSPEVRALPPISLSYFDPSDATYKFARSAPIPLHVRPGTMIVGDDADESDDSTADRSATAASRMPAGIAELDQRPLSDRSAASRLVEQLTPANAAFIGLTPLTAVMLLWGTRAAIASLRPAGPRARANKALRAARRGLRGAASPDQRAESVRTYLYASLDLPAASTTPWEAWQAAAPRSSPSTAASLRAALWPADWRFAPVSPQSTLTQSLDSAAYASLLDQVHAELLMPSEPARRTA